MPDESATLRSGALPDNLPLLRCRLTLRLLQDARLPAFKGPLLRGGFGYAFQRAVCMPECWGDTSRCTLRVICAYRRVFETPRPPGVAALHDLQDVPRPFVIRLPPDPRTSYAAGETIEFGLTLIGRGIEDLPYFLHGFERLGEMGLGRERALARLERAEALKHWSVTGMPIYQDGRVLTDIRTMPFYDAATIIDQAILLPSNLRLTLVTPLRLKSGGSFIKMVEPAALVRAICWRLQALSIFHGAGVWEADIRSLIEQARNIPVTDARVRWVERERTSDHRGRRERLSIGGLVGSATFHGLSPELRAILLAGTIIHVGKACVFGNGAFRLDPA